MLDDPRVKASSAPVAGRGMPWPRIWQRLSVRLLLVLGIVVFCAAVSVDSLQQAVAADMAVDAIAPTNPAAVNAVSPVAASDRSDRAVDDTGTYLEFNTETAQRLQHSDLLGPQLTRSRLTRAHLFPTLTR
jgi:hypothetical protein